MSTLSKVIIFGHDYLQQFATDYLCRSKTGILKHFAFSTKVFGLGLCFFCPMGYVPISGRVVFLLPVIFGWMLSHLYHLLMSRVLWAQYHTMVRKYL